MQTVQYGRACLIIDAEPNQTKPRRLLGIHHVITPAYCFHATRGQRLVRSSLDAQALQSRMPHQFLIAFY